MPKVPYKTSKSTLTVNINQPYKNEINALTGWLPAYPGIDDAQGVEWIPLVTTNGIPDPQVLHPSVRFDGPMQPTAALLSTTRLINAWTVLGIPYDNAKLIKILPGGILPRMECSTRNNYWRDRMRVYVMIQSDANVNWDWDGEPKTFLTGEVHIVHQGLYHSAINNGTQDCIYLLADIPLTESDRILSL